MKTQSAKAANDTVKRTSISEPKMQSFHIRKSFVLWEKLEDSDS